MSQVERVYEIAALQQPLDFFASEVFRQAIEEDLQILPRDTVKEDKYLNAVNALPRQYLSDGQFDLYIRIWQKILRHIKEYDRCRFATIHKGTPYYFMSMAAYLCEDFARALFYMDCAVAEDCKNRLKNEDWKQLPAGLFIRLDPNNRRQAARQLTENTTSIVNSFLQDYCRESGEHFTLAQLRKRFFEEAMEKNLPWRSACTALITFALEYDTRRRDLNLASKHGMSNEPFFLHLFKGGLLFETLLKACPDGSKDEYETAPLGKLLDNNDIGSKLGSKDGFQKVKKQMKERTFNQVIEEITKMTSGGEPFSNQVVGATYGVRNTTGHNLGWGTALGLEIYEMLFKRIMFACFLAISKLFHQ